MSITKTNYQDNVISSLKDELGVKSSMAVPKITKVTVNMGLGPDALNNRKSVDDAIADLELIAGQKPIKTFARKSVASFKIREGFPIGCKVTLRGMDICITTSANNDKEGFALLSKLNFPFKS